VRSRSEVEKFMVTHRIVATTVAAVVVVVSILIVPTAIAHGLWKEWLVTVADLAVAAVAIYFLLRPHPHTRN
jgi:hypothetical protein